MVYKYSLPVTLDGIETSKDVDVSVQMADAKTAIWVLYDPNRTEVVGVIKVVNETTIQINSDPALEAGEYFLVGIA
jgi:hypothetical protein